MSFATDQNEALKRFLKSPWADKLAAQLLEEQNRVKELKQQIEEHDRSILALHRQIVELTRQRDYYQGCLAHLSETVKMLQIEAPEEVSHG